MTCIRCEVTRAKIVANAMRWGGCSMSRIANRLNDMLEGEYVAESTGTHVRVYRNNPVPPHVEYEIISDPLP